MGEKDIDQKVKNFHNTIRIKLDEHFPEKTVMVSYLDKKWMSPQLENLNRKVKREFYKNRRSLKWRTLKRKFKSLKRKTIRNFYSNFVGELKESNSEKWYTMAKRIGAEQNSSNGELSVECLQGLDNQHAAEEVAKHFSRVSQEYSPLDLTKLPAYLPAPEVLEVDERLFELKRRK